MISISLVLLLIVTGVQGKPFFLINSAKPKCVTVTAPHGTKLRVNYEAPDIVIDEDGQAFITITAKLAKKTSVQNAKDLNDHLKAKLSGSKGGMFSEQLSNTQGSVLYETTQNGVVSVCIRSPVASKQNAMRFFLQVEKEEEVNAHDADSDPSGGHFSHMELEMQHLMNSMKNILSEADFSKQRESQFHHLTLEMHAASMWWPIVQLCVLLVTGFTQANHVVRFLKSKRLI